MRYPFSLYLSILILCLSCTDSYRQTNNEKNDQENKHGHNYKPPGSFTDTLKIDFPVVVFYTPDSLQLEKIKETTPKNNFDSEVHNCYYLMRNARMVLNKYWPQLQIIETSCKRYLVFKKKDKSNVVIDLDKADICGIFLFDGKK